MENQTKLNADVEAAVKRITEPIFKANSPQETPSNPMRAAEPTIRRLIQPHNFRRYFNFQKDRQPYYNPTIKHEQKNHNSEHHYKDFYGCHVIVRKNQVEVINLWHQKQWRLIEAYSIEQINERIEQIQQEMEQQTINAMQHFIKVNGGISDLRPITKRKAEIGIHGDDYIDNLPKDLIIHDTHFKKVYNEKVEFLGEASVKNYISNRALEGFMPELCHEIAAIREDNSAWMAKYEKHLISHTQFIQNSAAISFEVLKLLKRLNSRLDQKSLKGWV